MSISNIISKSLARVSQILAVMPASLHYSLYRIGWMSLPEVITTAKDSLFKTLHARFQVKILRRCMSPIVRSPFKSVALSLVQMQLSLPNEQGCIILTSHTPWKRLLVEWCLQKQFGIILSSSHWKQKRSTIATKGEGIVNLREMIDFLKNNGRLIITADAFNYQNDCETLFLGKKTNASCFPARLSKITGVPIITLIPTFVKDKVCFIEGPKYSNITSDEDIYNITRKSIEFLTGQIKRNPSIWRRFG